MNKIRNVLHKLKTTAIGDIGAKAKMIVEDIEKNVYNMDEKVVYLVRGDRKGTGHRVFVVR
jgi:hypothetical protein